MRRADVHLERARIACRNAASASKKADCDLAIAIRDLFEENGRARYLLALETASKAAVEADKKLRELQDIVALLEASGNFQGKNSQPRVLRRIAGTCKIGG